MGISQLAGKGEEVVSAEQPGMLGNRGNLADVRVAGRGRGSVVPPGTQTREVTAVGQSTGKEQRRVAQGTPANVTGRFASDSKANHNQPRNPGPGNLDAQIFPLEAKPSLASAGGSVALSSVSDTGPSSATWPSSEPRREIVADAGLASAPMSMVASNGMASHAFNRDARIEVGIQDASLGEVRVQALMDRAGAMHIDVIGHAQDTDAVLDKITPLLHAAVAQQLESHGPARTVHVTAGPTISGAMPITNSGTTALPQGGSLASSLSNNSQHSQQPRRQYSNEQSRSLSEGEPDMWSVTPTPGRNVFLAQPNGSSGLSVRI
ncbi:hypothetical protein [Terriglobus sp.]|uniref:hypothetical protein n=1 Tax=Terriglobus sp. TaxID=1889013 RepID=UPI003AFF89DD